AMSSTAFLGGLLAGAFAAVLAHNPHDLVFPTGNGNIESRGNLLRWGIWPTMIAAGITDAAGKTKYQRFHPLPHLHESWCINRNGRWRARTCRLVQEPRGPRQHRDDA